jgi:hypothetical protein
MGKKEEKKKPRGVEKGSLRIVRGGVQGSEIDDGQFWGRKEPRRNGAWFFSEPGLTPPGPEILFVVALVSFCEPDLVAVDEKMGRFFFGGDGA